MQEPRNPVKVNLTVDMNISMISLYFKLVKIRKNRKIYEHSVVY